MVTYEIALYQLRNYQRFSDQSATNCKRKVHYFLCNLFVLLYISRITVYISLIHSRNSEGFQTTSGASVSLSFLSYDHLSVYIHQCYICNVGGGSDSNRELQYLIQLVNVSPTQQFVSESLTYNIKEI